MKNSLKRILKEEKEKTWDILEKFEKEHWVDIGEYIRWLDEQFEGVGKDYQEDLIGLLKGKLARKGGRTYDEKEEVYVDYNSDDGKRSARRVVLEKYEDIKRSYDTIRRIVRDIGHGFGYSEFDVDKKFKYRNKPYLPYVLEGLVEINAINNPEELEGAIIKNDLRNQGLGTRFREKHWEVYKRFIASECERIKRMEELMGESIIEAGREVENEVANDVTRGIEKWLMEQCV